MKMLTQLSAWYEMVLHEQETLKLIKDIDEDVKWVDTCNTEKPIK